MNPAIVTTIAAAGGGVVAIWTMLANLDKRNADRFDAQQKQIGSSKETLRAEMKEMRAELRLEIREAADRRVIR